MTGSTIFFLFAAFALLILIPYLIIRDIKSGTILRNISIIGHINIGTYY